MIYTYPYLFPSLLNPTLSLQFLLKLQTQDYIGAQAIQKELLKKRPGDKLIQQFSSLLPSEVEYQKEAQQENEYGDEYYDEEEDKEAQAEGQEEEDKDEDENENAETP